jgi:hypothetical protein
MPLVVKDRVKETTTTTGTGTITLAGAASGFQSFSVIGNGNTTYYAIVGGTEWEVGIGTYTSSGTTLSRDTVLESSTGGTKVDFAAGTKDVFCTYPAEKSVYTDGSDNVTLPSNLSVNGTTTLGDASGDSVTFNASTVSTPNGLNFDSNTLVIDATNNRVGVGASPDNQKFQVFDATAARSWVIGNAETNFVAGRFSTDANGPALGLRKGRGTYASQTAVASGDTLGNILFQGYGGTNTRNLSEIKGFVDTYTSDSNISSYLTFGTSPSGSAAATERMRITAAGNVGIGITAPNVALDVLGVIEAQAALTQDAIKLQGRAGGSSSYAATITPATLTASRTVTLPDATGTAMVSGAMPTFRAYANANQTVTLSTFTKIAIDTEDFDTASCFDTSLYRFTPNVAGYYQVNGTLRGKVVTTFNTILLSLYKNGSGYTRTQVLATLAANNNNAISTNEVVYMNGTTDYLELYGVLGGSGTATFDATSSTITSTFSAVLVRAA